MANSTYNIDTSTRDYEQQVVRVVTGAPSEEQVVDSNIGSVEDLIKTTYNSREVLGVSDNHVEYNSGVCTAGNITVADILNLSSIRGGCKMSCGCGMKGGCLTCKDGVKNITHIYKTVHIIIPELYSKYNSDLIKKKPTNAKKNKKGK